MTLKKASLVFLVLLAYAARSYEVADAKASMVWIFAGDPVPSFGLDIVVYCHQVYFKMKSFNPRG
jgi:hypothetical protein